MLENLILPVAMCVRKHRIAIMAIVTIIGLSLVSPVSIIIKDISVANGEKSSNYNNIIIKTTNISKTQGFATNPQVARSGNNIYVVWVDASSGHNKIFFKKSSDGGANFGQAIDLNKNALSASDPRIAVSGSNVYVVWVNDFPHKTPLSEVADESLTYNEEIFYKKSNDNGATFGPTINLSNTPGQAFEPKISASGNNVHIIWTDAASNKDKEDIYYRVSTDGGTNFSNTKNLSNNKGDIGSSTPTIYSNGNNVYAVWVNFNTVPAMYEVYYSRSTDNGATFGPIIKLSGTSSFSANPDIAATTAGSGGSNNSNNNNNLVYVTWIDNTNGNWNIYFKRSIDGGASFGPTEDLSSKIGYAKDTHLTAFGNNVYITWIDSPLKTSILTQDDPRSQTLFRASTDNGATFGPIVNLSGNNTGAQIPQITAYGKYVCVMWVGGALGNDQMFMKESTDNGASFGSMVNLSNDAGDSGFSQIVRNGDKIDVVWSDDIPGHFQIFFTEVKL